VIGGERKVPAVLLDRADREQNDAVGERGAGFGPGEFAETCHGERIA
jgi:hypothetical protein